MPSVGPQRAERLPPQNVAACHDADDGSNQMAADCHDLAHHNDEAECTMQKMACIEACMHGHETEATGSGTTTEATGGSTTEATGGSTTDATGGSTTEATGGSTTDATGSESTG